MGPRGWPPLAGPTASRIERPRGPKNNLLVNLLLVLLLGVVGGGDTVTDSGDSEAEPETVVTECDPASLVNCGLELLTGQFRCFHPEVDPVTQQPRGCNLVNGTGKAPITCEAIPGIICNESCNQNFTRYEDCKWTNGYQFDTALLLSVFLGMFGADRFYLGYPAIGLLKFSTLGFFFIGHLVDIILIASQTVGPADGSYYVINYFGAGLSRITVSDETYRREEPDWY